MNGKITNNGPNPIYSRDELGKTVRLEVGQSIDFKMNPYRMTDAVDVALPPMPTRCCIVTNLGADRPQHFMLSTHLGVVLMEKPTGATLDLFSADQVRAYAIQAVMEERERCAAICREHCEDALGVPFKNYEDTHHDGYQDAANDIESAIRAQPEPEA